ncbi:hypothetical protein SH580_17360 [Coraliomargarita algicola]|uniref:PEP-CTERM sorting domain-containing protein n=1 Tax=Coraliomargarita algicola TaxID=3092156 RepID=A0ABZ0RI95_9BACT|nr:hypothetical protein [Coraliomargarita sp. J2-16]WPJ95193.1 hypothetical protein SH580_17360 [Coraliomargarita sp. J2-16]
MKLLPSFLTAVSVSLLSATAHATTLASWDVWADNSGSELDADFTFAGFTASIGYDASRAITGFGSNDGTFGTLSGASTASSALLVREDNGTSLTLTLTNNTVSAYSIDTLNFDFISRQGSSSGRNGFTTFDITYTSGGLGAGGTAIGTQVVQTPTAGITNANLPDYDYTLSDYLADTTLGAGESAVFTFDFEGNLGHDGSSISSLLDNVAFTGTAMIPSHPLTQCLRASSRLEL